MSIGQVIKVVREERGLTQSQFAHELFVTQQALSRWEKGTAEPSIDMIRLISTRFEAPMARLMEMPDNGFCQSCAMPFYRPEDHGTEPDGTRSGDYCNYCYDDGVFLQDYANSDELVAACAPMMAESCHISVEQAEDCMSALLPNLKRWRHQDEIDAVAEGE
ncbi:MAG: zinc ribbon domain-containing protein [Bifidobacterium longum]